MADYKIQLQDEQGNRQYPVTLTNLVVDSDGRTAEQRLLALEGGSGGGGGVAVDTEMSDTSANPVQNNVIKSYVDGVAQPLDERITELEQSGGGGGGGSVTVDTEMSDTSANPVENSVIKAYVDDSISTVSTLLEGKADTGSLAAVATSGSYGDLTDTPAFKTVNGESIIGDGNIEVATGDVIVDAAMSDESANAVQNKVIKAYVDEGIGSVTSLLEGKADSESLAAVATSGSYDDLGDAPTFKTVNGMSVVGEGNIYIREGKDFTVDEDISATSTNAVQNKAVKAYVDEKARSSYMVNLPASAADLSLTEEQKAQNKAAFDAYVAAPDDNKPRLYIGTYGAPVTKPMTDIYGEVVYIFLYLSISIPQTSETASLLTESMLYANLMPDGSIEEYVEAEIPVPETGSIKTINGISLIGQGDIVISEAGESVSVDAEMSDESVNPVQNKVVKSYVDEAVANSIIGYEGDVIVQIVDNYYNGILDVINGESI